MLVTSALSMMLKWGFRPITPPSWRSMRTPKAWKVQINTSLAALPIRLLARSRISAAALLVKVIAAMRFGRKPSLNEAADLVRDDARLARARTRQHQTRTVQEIDGFLLREIQTSRHSGDS